MNYKDAKLVFCIILIELICETNSLIEELNKCRLNSVGYCKCVVPEDGIGSLDQSIGGYLSSNPIPPGTDYALNLDRLTFSLWLNVGILGDMGILGITHIDIPSGALGYHRMFITNAGPDITCSRRIRKKDSSNYDTSVTLTTTLLSHRSKWLFIICAYTYSTTQLHKDLSANIASMNTFPPLTDLNPIKFNQLFIGKTDSATSNIFQGRILDIHIFKDYVPQSEYEGLMYGTLPASYSPFFSISMNADAGGNILAQTTPDVGTTLIPQGSVSVVTQYVYGMPYCNGDGVSIYGVDISIISLWFTKWTDLPILSTVLSSCAGRGYIGIPFDDPLCLLHIQEWCCAIGFAGGQDSNWEDLCFITLQLGIISQCDSSTRDLDVIISECYSAVTYSSCSALPKCRYENVCYGTHYLQPSLTLNPKYYAPDTECVLHNGDAATCATTLTTLNVPCKVVTICAPHVDWDCDTILTQIACVAQAANGCAWIPLSATPHIADTLQCKRKDCGIYTTNGGCTAITFCYWDGGRCRPKVDECLYSLACAEAHCQVLADQCVPDCGSIGSRRGVCVNTPGCEFLSCIPDSSLCTDVNLFPVGDSSQCERPAFPACKYTAGACAVSDIIIPQYPRLSSAIFASNGMYLDIRFTSGTNYGSNGNIIIDCSILLDSAILAKMGSSPKCVWLDIYTVRVWLGSSSTVVAEVITLNPSVISDITGSAFLTGLLPQLPADLDILALFHASPDSSLPVISSPQTPSSCQNLTLSASNSNNNGQRLPSYSWTFTLTPDDILFRGAYDSAAPSPLLESIVIPASALDSNTIYSVQLSITNFMSMTSSLGFTFTPNDYFAPTLSAPHGHIYNFIYSKSYEINLKVEISACVPMEVENIVVEWSLISVTGHVGFTLATYLGSTLDMRRIIHTKYSLLPGAVLTLQAIAYDRDSYSLDNKALSKYTIIVNSLQSQMECEIADGEREVSAKKDLILDGSGSHDPDDLATPPTMLWECLVWQYELEKPCVGLTFTPLATDPVVTILAADLQNDLTYTFKLTVTDPSDISRVGRCSRKINTTSMYTPKAAFQTMRETMSVNGNRETIMHIGEKHIYTEHRREEIASGTWEVMNPPSPAPIFAFPSPRGPHNAISPGILTPGHTYKIRYTLTENSGGHSRTEILLHVNEGPKGGKLVVSPASGLEMLTLFTIQLSGWEGGRGAPLTYSFYMKHHVDGLILLSQEGSTQGEISVRLPLGDPPGYALEIIGEVFSYDGASTTTTALISVHPLTPIQKSLYLKYYTIYIYSMSTPLSKLISGAELMSHIQFLRNSILINYSLEDNRYPQGITYSPTYLEYERELVEGALHSIEHLYYISNKQAEDIRFTLELLSKLCKEPLTLSYTSRIKILSLVNEILGTTYIQQSYMSNSNLQRFISIWSSIKYAIEFDPHEPHSLLDNKQSAGYIQDGMNILCNMYIKGRIPSHLDIISTPSITAYFSVIYTHNINSWKINLPSYIMNNTDPLLEMSIIFPRMTYTPAAQERSVSVIMMVLERLNPIYTVSFNNSGESKSQVVWMNAKIVGDISENGGIVERTNTSTPPITNLPITGELVINVPMRKGYWDPYIDIESERYRELESTEGKGGYSELECRTLDSGTWTWTPNMCSPVLLTNTSISCICQFPTLPQHLGIYFPSINDLSGHLLPGIINSALHENTFLYRDYIPFQPPDIREWIILIISAILLLIYIWCIVLAWMKDKRVWRESKVPEKEFDLPVVLKQNVVIQGNVIVAGAADYRGSSNANTEGRYNRYKPRKTAENLPNTMNYDLSILDMGGNIPYGDLFPNDIAKPKRRDLDAFNIFSFHHEENPLHFPCPGSNVKVRVLDPTQATLPEDYPDRRAVGVPQKSMLNTLGLHRREEFVPQSKTISLNSGEDSPRGISIQTPQSNIHVKNKTNNITLTTRPNFAAVDPVYTYYNHCNCCRIIKKEHSILSPIFNTNWNHRRIFRVTEMYITILMLFIYTGIWTHLYHGDTSNRNFLEHWDDLTLLDFALCFIFTACVFPITLILFTLFQWDDLSEYMDQDLYDRIYLKNRCRMWVAIFFSIIIVALSWAFEILFVLEYGWDKSKRWLVLWILCLILEIFIIDFIKIAIKIMILSLGRKCCSKNRCCICLSSCLMNTFLISYLPTYDEIQKAKELVGKQLQKL